MSGLRYNAHPWLLLLILAVLVTRVDGIHLHLCFDGQEPPATVHAVSPSHDDTHPAEQRHTDKDVQVFDAVLTKGKGPVDLPMAFAACLLLVLVLHPASRQWPLAAFYRIFTLQPFALRPPLRGPPL